MCHGMCQIDPCATPYSSLSRRAVPQNHRCMVIAPIPRVIEAAALCILTKKADQMPAANILVVDDSKVSRTVVCGLIKNRVPQAHITEAGDGRTALSMALASLPDLVVLDINMPDMSGIEVAEQLRALAPQVRIALLTANVQDAMRNKAEALGVPIFKKPAKAEVIDQILALLGAA